MSGWVIWFLRAWVALTLLVGVAAAVDPGDPERSRAGPAAGSAVGVITPAPSTSTPTRTPESPDTPVAGPVAVPVRVEAPAVGISAGLIGVGKTDDGALAVPDFGTAGWYEQSVRPGAPGPAVLAGHVDSTSGPDVFFALGDLAAGDDIVVHRSDGSTATFVVDHVETTDKDELPVERIFGPTPGPSLRLITCGGAFDRSIRSYESNVIVYARPAPSTNDLASGRFPSG